LLPNPHDVADIAANRDNLYVFYSSNDFEMHFFLLMANFRRPRIAQRLHKRPSDSEVRTNAVSALYVFVGRSRSAADFSSLDHPLSDVPRAPGMHVIDRLCVIPSSISS
jgi:hypothetical protein